jgi:DNA modification methylase
MQVDNVGAMNLQAWKRSTGTFNNIVYSEKVKSPKHPTQKPVSVLRSLIKTCSPVNGIVLDPFMGCGSSGVAALLENRKFVGVERSPVYFEEACLRIEKIVRTKLRKLKR